MDRKQFLLDLIGDEVLWYETGYEEHELLEMFRQEGFIVEFYNQILEGDAYFYRYQGLLEKNRLALLIYGARGGRLLIYK